MNLENKEDNEKFAFERDPFFLYSHFSVSYLLSLFRTASNDRLPKKSAVRRRKIIVTQMALQTRYSTLRNCSLPFATQNSFRLRKFPNHFFLLSRLNLALNSPLRHTLSPLNTNFLIFKPFTPCPARYVSVLITIIRI